MNKNYFGVDISKDKLQIAFQNNQNIWQDSVIPNEHYAIENWIAKVDLDTSHFVFEYTGTYTHPLTYCLELLGAKFTIITPKQSKGFSLSMKATSKTDKSDARLLCVYGQKYQPEITILPSEKLHQKRQKYNYFITLKADYQSFKNRLHALSFDSKADKSVVKSIEKMIITIGEEIDSLQKEIFTIDDDENRHLKELMTSVVGIGEASANAIIIATNGLKDFDNIKQVSKFLGIAPSDNDSGSSVRGNRAIVKSGTTYVRNTLFMAARSAKKYNIACKDIYERLRAKGKPHKVAMMAVVHKLLKQVVAVVKNKTMFDNNYQLTK
jgi:transposase